MSSCETEDDDVDLKSLDLTGKIMIAQWNIGHFNGGFYGSESNISADEYELKKDEYNSFISSVPASIFSINEYTQIFATDMNGIVHQTKDVLFTDFNYNHIGENVNGSCNAIFSKTPISEVHKLEYKCNETATITHNPNLYAAMYYILEAKTEIFGKEVIFVSTHLAFDMKNEDVALNQIKEIINRYRNEDNVILCGDWNVLDVSSFDLFSSAGYQLANHGKFGDYLTCSYYAIDNIVVKGFDIEKTYIKRTSLSDHNMIIAVLSPK